MSDQQSSEGEGKPKARLFEYVKPEFTRSKAMCLLGRTDIAVAAVQVIREGGENNLHSHRHSDGFWFVLSGRARFYTTDDEVVAECGKYQGVMLPRDFPYWFESVGSEDLELMQFEAHDTSSGSANLVDFDRVDHVPPKRMAPEDIVLTFGSVDEDVKQAFTALRDRLVDAGTDKEG